MKEWFFFSTPKVRPIVGYIFQFDDVYAEYDKDWIVTKVPEGEMLAHRWANKDYLRSSEIRSELKHLLESSQS